MLSAAGAEGKAFEAGKLLHFVLNDKGNTNFLYAACVKYSSGYVSGLLVFVK